MDDEKKGRGKRHTLPYIFIKQGISMLASVLHGKISVNASMGIIRVMVMWRFIANNALLFECISNVQLKQLEYRKQTDERLE